MKIADCKMQIHGKELYHFKLLILYQFRVLKKWGDRLCWGPGARTERAGSIGRAAPWPQRSKLVSSGGGGGYLPRPIPEEISAL